MSASSVKLADVEKARMEPGSPELDLNEPRIGDHGAPSASPPSSLGATIARHIKNFEKQLVEYNLEARGIQRVEVDERLDLTRKNYAQAFLLWFSINLAANNVTLGMLGPAVYGLSFTDASLCAVFGSVVGSLPVAYIATWGPISGNRTMVLLPLSAFESTKLILLLRYLLGIPWDGGQAKFSSCSI